MFSYNDYICGDTEYKSDFGARFPYKYKFGCYKAVYGLNCL